MTLQDHLVKKRDRSLKYGFLVLCVLRGLRVSSAFFLDGHVNCE